MKIKGTQPGSPEPIFCIFERGEKEFVLRVDAVYDYDEFDKIYPEPKPPTSMKPGGIKTVQTDHPTYLTALDKYSEARSTWMILKSLSQTEDLEWEKVSMSDPDTWKLYREELKEAGFTDGELAYLLNKVVAQMGVDHEKMDQARERFTRTQVAATQYSYLMDERMITLCGVLASDTGYYLQVANPSGKIWTGGHRNV